MTTANSGVTRAAIPTRNQAFYLELGAGTGIVFLGTIAGMLFAFLGRVLVTRFFSQSEYGIFSLGLTIMEILVMVSCMGLQVGAARQLAFYRGQGEAGKVGRVVVSSVQIVLASSIALAIILFLSASFVAGSVFHEPASRTPLSLLAIAIPFLALIYVTTAIFRGFSRAGGKALFEDFLRNALFPVFLLPVILLQLSFTAVIYAFVGAIIVTCLAYAIYFVRKVPSLSSIRISLDFSTIGKGLLIFSLPLLGMYLLDTAIYWADTLMLGSLKTPDVVGLYSAAVPLARFLSISLTAVSFIYLPLISQLYSLHQSEGMNKLYITSTKLTCLMTIPLSLVVVLYPGTILAFFFGQNYLPASAALRILAIGFTMHSILGLSGAALVGMGRTRFIMLASLSGAIVNIALGIALIPSFGINGAAIASLSSIVLVDIVCLAKLSSICKKLPINRNLIKPMALAIILALLINLVAVRFLIITWWMLPGLALFFLVVYGLSTLLTRSLDREDIDLLLAIERRLGLNLGAVKRMLGRFV